MRIDTNFPFKHCDSCPECILDIEHTTLFGDNQIVTRQITVRCKNADLCRRLEEVRNAERNRADTDER